MSSFTFSRPMSPNYQQHPGSSSNVTTLQVTSRESSSDIYQHKMPRAYLSDTRLDQSQGEPDTESSILVSKVPVTQKSPLYSTTSSSKKVTIWPLGTTVHRLPVYELEKQLKKMKPTQITTICLDLAAQLRTLETQLEKFKK